MSQVSREITEFKADDPEGFFAAKVSVFRNKDRNGDKVMGEAFDRTIDIWRTSGKNIPVVWSHDHKNPDAFIGYVNPNDVVISEDGVIVAGKLDIKGNPLALRAFNLLSDGLVNEWSFAYKVNKEKMGLDGAREIYDLDLFEVGPTLIGANPETLTLATKEAELEPVSTTSDGTETAVSPPEDKAIDRSEWDGAAAMASANNASEYRAICAGERSTGDPDERQHWALPHHKSAGAPPNANGVRNALARLSQTEGLKNKQAAQAHLERHMAAISSESKLGSAVDQAVAELDDALDTLIEEKIGRVISRRTEEKIRSAVAQLTNILAVLDEEALPVAGSPSEEKSQPAPPSENELRRRRIESTGLFLAERGRG